MPFPVHTSSARSTGSLIGEMREGRGGAVDAGDAVGSLDVEAVGRDQELVVRDDAHEAVEEAVAQLGQPGLDQELSEVARGHRVAEQQEREERREAIGSGREPPPVHLQIGVREDRLAGRVQAPGDPGDR